MNYVVVEIDFEYPFKLLSKKGVSIKLFIIELKKEFLFFLFYFFYLLFSKILNSSSDSNKISPEQKKLLNISKGSNVKNAKSPSSSC